MKLDPGVMMMVIGTMLVVRWYSIERERIYPHSLHIWLIDASNKCKPCLASTNELKSMKQEYADKGRVREEEENSEENFEYGISRRRSIKASNDAGHDRIDLCKMFPGIQHCAPNESSISDMAKDNCRSTKTIAVYGDFQHIPQSFQTTLRAIKMTTGGKGPDIHILNGDISPYERSSKLITKHFGDQGTTLSPIILPAMGNHDQHEIGTIAQYIESLGHKIKISESSSHCKVQKNSTGGTGSRLVTSECNDIAARPCVSPDLKTELYSNNASLLTYSVAFSGFKIIVVNDFIGSSGRSWESKGAQSLSAWFQDQFDSTHDAEEIDPKKPRRWNIAVGHFPIATEFRKKQQSIFWRKSQAFRNTLTKSRVHLYLCGHSHHVSAVKIGNDVIKGRSDWNSVGGENASLSTRDQWLTWEVNSVSIEAGTSIESNEQRATWPSWIVLTVNITHLEVNAYRRIKATVNQDSLETGSHVSETESTIVVATPRGKVLWKIDSVFHFGIDSDGRHYGDSVEYIQQRSMNL